MFLDVYNMGYVSDIIQYFKHTVKSTKHTVKCFVFYFQVRTTQVRTFLDTWKKILDLNSSSLSLLKL